MAQYQVLYWHDIPVQVRAGRRRERVSHPLAPRFQAAIDKAAMAADLTGTDAYLDAFTWGAFQERPGTAAEVAAAVARELEERQPQVDWRRTVADIMADGDESR